MDLSSESAASAIFHPHMRMPGSLLTALASRKLLLLPQVKDVANVISQKAKEGGEQKLTPTELNETDEGYRVNTKEFKSRIIDKSSFDSAAGTVRSGCAFVVVAEAAQPFALARFCSA